MDRQVEPERLVCSLAETPARIKAAVRQLPAARLAGSPAPGVWSPNEILWHVRAVADVYGEHILRILNEDTPRWRHVSPRARMKKARYDLLPFAESIAAFERQRAELLALLHGAAAKEWERAALVRVPARPRDREWRLTLHERVRGMAEHETSHCSQMEEVAAALR